MELIKTHQQKIALVVGFAAVAAIGFWGGKSINQKIDSKPAVSASSIQSNYTQSGPEVQTTSNLTTQPSVEALDCTGKIKGSSSHIYHVLGGAFYKKTTRPIACFDTEAEAKAAGFRKASR